MTTTDSAGRPATAPPRLTARLVLGAVVALAVALRSWDLGARSIWFDEAMEYWTAVAPVRAIPGLVAGTLQPPLYSLVLKAWLLGGAQPVWLRSLSVILSLGTLLAVVALARRHLGTRGGAIGGLLMAVLPGEVRYAQEVGEYALATCALAWSLVALDRAVDEPRWRWWLAWGALSTIAVYSHYGTAVVVAPLGAATLLAAVRSGRRGAAVRQLTTSAAAVLAAAPLGLDLLPRQLEQPAIDIATRPLGSPVSEASALVAGVGETFLFLLTGWPFTAVPLAAGAAGLALALGLAAWRLVAGPAAGRRPLAWLGLALAAYVLAVRSGMYGHGAFGFRYALVLDPLFAVSVAAGLTWLWRRAGAWPAGLAGAALLALTVVALPNRSLSEATRGVRVWPETEELGPVTAQWLAERSPGEPIYVYYGAAPGFRYYLRLLGAEAGPVAPDWTARCWADDGPACASDGVHYGTWLRDRPPGEMASALFASLGRRPDRWWVVFAHVRPGEELGLLDAIGDSFAIERAIVRTNASAYRLAKR